MITYKEKLEELWNEDGIEFKLIQWLDERLRKLEEQKDSSE